MCSGICAKILLSGFVIFICVRPKDKEETSQPSSPRHETRNVRVTVICFPIGKPINIFQKPSETLVVE